MLAIASLVSINTLIKYQLPVFQF